MKKTVFFIVALVTLNCFAQNQNFLERPYLETSATYTTEVVPDRIYLSITITENDTRGKISVEEMETRMMVRLKAIGIDTDKQLSLSSLDSDFRRYFLKKTDILKNKSYTLLVYDGKTAGQVIRELELVNISNINLEKYEYSKIEELKVELRGKAVEKAKRQAEAMLQPVEQTVGKALLISDMRSNITRALSGKARGVNTNLYGNMGPSYEIAPIDFDKIKVYADVTVYFEIL